MTLEEAYTATNEAEKSLVLELVDVLKEFKDKLSEIRGRQPAAGAQSAAQLFLGRVESAVSNVSSYDLDGVRSSYGIAAPALVMA